MILISWIYVFLTFSEPPMRLDDPLDKVDFNNMYYLEIIILGFFFLDIFLSIIDRIISFEKKNLFFYKAIIFQ
jgi:hypothetical protein